jgi:uncharacterized protein (TIGR03000 family)
MGGCYGGGYMGGGYGGGYAGGYAYAPSYAPAMYGGSYGPPVTYAAAQTPSGPQPATLVVNLPADAKLTVDGAPTTSTSERRTFVTPALRPGQDYAYTLRAEITRDGQTFNASQRVTVSPGRQSEVTLTIPTATTASR